MAFSLYTSFLLILIRCPISSIFEESWINKEIFEMGIIWVYFLWKILKKIFTHSGYNGWFSIFRKSIGAVMQNTVIVIGGIEVCHYGMGVFSEIVLFALFHIFIMNFNIIISIVCALHVMETKCCFYKKKNKFNLYKKNSMHLNFHSTHHVKTHEL